MLTDVKTWLETTTYKVAEEYFKEPPKPPYIIFIEESDVGGADDKNCIAERKISIEMYSLKIDKIAEKAIENLLNEKAIKYKRYHTWIESEEFFQTVYDFNLVEKI